MTENYPPASAMPAEPLPSADWGERLPPLPPQEEQGTADALKSQAADLGQSTAEAGRQTVGVAQEQASAVAGEAGRQGKYLLRQAQDELGGQAAQGQHRLATELLSLGDELSSMADKSDQHGLAADLARRAGEQAHGAGQWLSNRNPAQVMDEVQAFARRRPGAFLGLAVGAGLVAGRLTRGIKAAHDDDLGATSAPAPAPAPASVSAPEPDLSSQWDQPTAGSGYEAGSAVVGTSDAETPTAAYRTVAADPRTGSEGTL